MNATNLDPRIGILCRGGMTVYYAFLNGYGRPELVGTLAEVETALGLRKAAPVALPNKAKIRTYKVTVTPAFETYGSHGTNGAYTLDIDAESGKDAISKAREQRRGQEGRHAVPATYRARLA